MKLIQGDCLEVMKTLPDNSVDAIITDLPYGTTACKWDVVIPLEPMWTHVKRLLKKNGVFVTTASQPFTSALIMSNPKWFRYCWVWEKSKATGFLNAKKRPLVAHEDIVVFSCNAPVYYPQRVKGLPYSRGMRKAQTENDVYGKFDRTFIKSSDGKRYPRSVLKFKTAETEGETYHKTQKPVALFEYLIKTYTNEGDTVLDFCMGSGTTGVACVQTGRHFIGIENDLTYFNIATRRIEDTDPLFQAVRF